VPLEAASPRLTPEAESLGDPVLVIIGFRGILLHLTAAILNTEPEVGMFFLLGSWPACGLSQCAETPSRSKTHTNVPEPAGGFAGWTKVLAWKLS
jgi:hypothetical protein